MDDLQAEKHYRSMRAYGQSKLALVCSPTNLRMPYRLLCNKVSLRTLRGGAKRRVGCKWLVGRDDQITIHLVGTANEADYLNLAAAKRPLAVLISSPTSPLSALT
jgi:hypothetical protein